MEVAPERHDEREPQDGPASLVREGAPQPEQLQRDHLKVAPFVILFQEIEVAARRKNVDGFIIGPNFGTNFYYAIAKK